MALSNNYTAKMLHDDLRLLVNEISPKKVQKASIINFINYAIQDVVEMLAEAGLPDYNVRVSVNDDASSVNDYPGDVVTGANSTSSGSYGAIITKTSHGLTVNDVGVRIVAWNTTSKIMIAQIARIVDDDNFEVNQEFGVSIPSSLNYSVFSKHTATSIDLGSYDIDKIIKVRDSNLGLGVPADTEEFENLDELDNLQDNFWWYQEGESLLLYKGSNTGNFGTISVIYKRMPNLISALTDYIDARDKWIPLILAKAKLYIYEIADKNAPADVTSIINRKSKEIREANLAEEKFKRAQQ